MQGRPITGASPGPYSPTLTCSQGFDIRLKGISKILDFINLLIREASWQLSRRLICENLAAILQAS